MANSANGSTATALKLGKEEYETLGADNLTGDSTKNNVVVNVRVVEKGERLDDCAIIILIGCTGTGKSHFIETIASRPSHGSIITGIAESKMDAGTLEVQAYRMDHAHLNLWTRKPIILVDTPGLSDRRKSEVQVLGQIKKWMKTNNVKTVDRLFYMDRISDKRMPGSKQNCLEIFKALSGQEAARRTIVVTTMWDLMWDIRLANDANHRFDLLQKDHWKDFLDLGSKIEKFDNTFESAVKNLQAFGPPAQDVGPDFAFEKDVHMRETEVGRVAFQVLTQRRENLELNLKNIQKSIELAKESKNAELNSLLQKQKYEAETDLNQVSHEIKKYSRSKFGFEGLMSKVVKLATSNKHPEHQ